MDPIFAPNAQPAVEKEKAAENFFRSS